MVIPTVSFSLMLLVRFAGIVRRKARRKSRRELWLKGLWVHFIKTSVSEVACTYAALILCDENIPITVSFNITTGHISLA
jgi:hypothetical protein